MGRTSARSRLLPTLPLSSCSTARAEVRVPWLTWTIRPSRTNRNRRDGPPSDPHSAHVVVVDSATCGLPFVASGVRGAPTARRGTKRSLACTRGGALLGGASRAAERAYPPCGEYARARRPRGLRCARTRGADA